MMKSIVQPGGAVFEAEEVGARSTPFDDLAAVHAEHEALRAGDSDGFVALNEGMQGPLLC